VCAEPEPDRDQVTDRPTTVPSLCDGDVALMSNYVDHLLPNIHCIQTVLTVSGRVVEVGGGTSSVSTVLLRRMPSITAQSAAYYDCRLQCLGLDRNALRRRALSGANMAQKLGYPKQLRVDRIEKGDGPFKPTCGRLWEIS